MFSDSFVLPPHPSSAHSSDDVDSLPSSSVSTASDDSQADRDAQAEWERSVRQLESLLTLVLVPFLGKWMGRQFAYWGAFFGPWIMGWTLNACGIPR